MLSHTNSRTQVSITCGFCFYKKNGDDLGRAANKLKPKEDTEWTRWEMWEWDGFDGHLQDQYNTSITCPGGIPSSSNDKMKSRKKLINIKVM